MGYSLAGEKHLTGGGQKKRRIKSVFLTLGSFQIYPSLTAQITNCSDRGYFVHGLNHQVYLIIFQVPQVSP